MTDHQIKHLEFIQSAINRMAANSFLLKGWSVTLAVALLGFAAKDSNVKFALLALVPPLCFWGLDAYYLRQERLFRKLYDKIRAMSDTDWPTSGKFDMSTATVSGEVSGLIPTLFSPTVFLIHLIVITLVLAILFYFHALK